MKKIMSIFMFLTLSLFSLYLNVNAVSGGYSGEGQGQGYSGGTSSGGERCTGGACLAAGAGIKFTLVNISNSKLEALSYGYMRSTGNKYGGEYFDSKNVHGGGAIEGIILGDGNYNYGAFGNGNYVELESFEEMNTIIPKGQAGLNFYQEKLKENILEDPSCSSKGIDCVLTDEFADISVILLRKANIISSSDTLSTITAEQKNTISNLRIIIEPVYALFLNGYKGSKYVFSTPKSIAYKFASSDYYGKPTVLGISDFANSLYKQIYTIDTLGTIINSPSYIVPSNDEQKVNSFLNLNTGAGYSIAKILYEINKCDIRKDGSEYTYVDNNGNEWNNDINGDNLRYYLTQSNSGCGCEAFNSSAYKSELLNSNEKFQEIYDSICVPPVVKSCEYEKNGANYTFYGKTGNILSSYSEFIDDCECSHPNVLSLKSIGGFAAIYNSSGCLYNPTESYSGSINKCSDSQSYDDAKSNTNFSNYTLGYNKESTINSYCTEVCDEVININDLKGKYTTEAGEYFEFSKYPNLVANKTCTVSIDYNTWSTVYESNLQVLVEAYNVWREAVAAAASVSYGSCCSSYTCGPYGTSCCSATKYIYNYSYNKASIVNKTNLQYVTGSGYYTSCGSPINWNVSGKLSTFQGKSANATSIANLKNDLRTCNNRLGIAKSNTTSDDTITDAQFYNFDQKLNYYYAQTYSNNSIGLKYNNERSSYGGIDDSNFVESETKTANQSGSGGDRQYATLTESGINQETIYTYTSDIKRVVQYSVDYQYPDKEKYAEIFTGKISTYNNPGKSIYLGYVYDIDASAKAKNNNINYYSFSKLGDAGGTGKIFNKFKTGDSIKRYCDYEITNPIIESCPDGTCDSKLDIVFRIVDPTNLDPNSRLGTANGLKNWNNVKGETVISTIQSTDTYNPNNLEYSFSLDSASIKKIREYNSNCDATGSCDPIKYSDMATSYSELSCNDSGNECTSKFITELSKSSGAFGKNIATNTDGRNKWKYLIYNTSTNNWSIEVKDAGDVSSSMFNSLVTQYRGLGVDVTP